jgi:2-polyprenyl-3-methyl-5-hydroxy-6-metoxy-1,4-benzoquinol methylase
MTNLEQNKNEQEHREQSFGMQKLSRLDTLIYNLRVAAIKKYCACHGQSVLDVGCGYNATFLRYIQQHYNPRQCSAFDLVLNKESLQQANIICREGDLNNPFPQTEKYDLIFATAILEHLEQPISFLQECFATLAPGGRLLLTTPSIYSQPVLEFLAYKLHIISEEEIRDHKEYYDKKKLLAYFTQA